VTHKEEINNKKEHYKHLQMLQMYLLNTWIIIYTGRLMTSAVFYSE